MPKIRLEPVPKVQSAVLRSSLSIGIHFGQATSALTSFTIANFMIRLLLLPLPLCLCLLLTACSQPTTPKKQIAQPIIQAHVSSEAERAINNNPQTKQAYEFLNGKPSVVFYFANWCPHCVRMKPAMTALYNKYSEQINFIFVNVDQPDLQKMIQTLRPGGGGIPHFQFYDQESKMLGERTGALPQANLEATLQKLLD